MAATKAGQGETFTTHVNKPHCRNGTRAPWSNPWGFFISNPGVDNDCVNSSNRYYEHHREGPPSTT